MSAGKMGRLQNRAIECLLTESTIEKAAAKTGISYRSLKNWLARDDFAAAYATARRAILGDAVGQLQAITRLAVDTLAACMTDTQARQADRVRAALGVLEHAIPRKIEATLRDGGANEWEPVLAALPDDSPEFKALVALSERVLAGSPQA